MADLVLELKASCLPNLWSNHQLLHLEGPRRGILPELMNKLHWGPHLGKPQKSNFVFFNSPWIGTDLNLSRAEKKNLWSRLILKFYIAWGSFSICLPSIFFVKIRSLFKLSYFQWGQLNIWHGTFPWKVLDQEGVEDILFPWFCWGHD